MNQQYPVGRSAKKNFLGPSTRTEILSQPKNKSLLQQLPELVQGCCENPKYFSLCTLDEIKSNLRKQCGNEVKQISIKKNNQIISTNAYILNLTL